MDRESTRPVLVPVRGGLNPAYLLIPLVLGLVIGLGLGLKDRITGSRVDRDESYIVLASTLYGQNPTQEAATELRQRLVRLGIAEPSYTVLTLADTFERSRDDDLKNQADGLRLFGQALGGATSALVNVPTPTNTPAATVSAAGAETPGAALATPTAGTPGTTTAGSTPAATATPTAPATETPTVLSTAIKTPEATATPEPTATTEPTSTPTARKSTATPTKSSGTAINRPATVSTGIDQNVLIRTGPWTNRAIIATVPNGSKVTVLSATTGEVIINKSSRWYLVQWKSSTGKIFQGYVYGLLVSFTD